MYDRFVWLDVLSAYSVQPSPAYDGTGLSVTAFQIITRKSQ